jgi:hypothetical protein
VKAFISGLRVCVEMQENLPVAVSAIGLQKKGHVSQDKSPRIVPSDDFPSAAKKYLPD